MEQIAERLEITKGGLSKALNGNPTLKTLRSVAEVLGVPVMVFFQDELTDDERRQFQQPTAATTSGVLTCPHCGQPVTVCLE